MYSKGDINDAIPTTVHYLECQFDCSVKQLFMDNERSLSSEFFAWISCTGCHFTPTAPYMHKQAGLIE